MSTLNTPYVKKYNLHGEVINELTKDKPYRSGVSLRKYTRGHLKSKLSEFVQNPDGSKKLITEKRTSRGKWVHI